MEKKAMPDRRKLVQQKEKKEVDIKDTDHCPAIPALMRYWMAFVILMLLLLVILCLQINYTLNKK